jgi:thioredoxin reductase
MPKKYKTAIIGAGPAGIAAGIQLHRSGGDYVIFEKDRIGGLIHNANLIENYPGFPNGLSGLKFASLLEKHADKMNLNIKFESVIEVNFANNIFSIHTDNSKYQADILIVASGTRPVKEIGIDIPAHLREKVFYEVKDIPDIKNESIGIIGGGDAAFDYALGLAENNRVVILIRDSGAKCLPLLAARADYNPNIEIYNQTKALSIKDRGDKILLNCVKEGNFVDLQFDKLIIAIGRVPQLDFMRDIPHKCDRIGYIGDVANGIYRQATIAAADGIRAAMKIVNHYGTEK